jgi:hypothetical protein
MLNRLNLNKSDLLEYYVLLLLAVGLPLVAFVYLDWRAALTAFVLSQIIVGVLAIRATSKGVAE